jgi:eukaryotic-like serine/threonine-protein kinase
MPVHSTTGFPAQGASVRKDDDNGRNTVEATLAGAATTSATPPPGFAVGELVGGRYRLLRLLGEGGMGVVFEAEDLMLSERVALKAIRPEVGQDEKVVERFKREIQLARKVTHPNVCRIFDVGFHQTGSGAPGVFLTMELLAGETLAQRIARGRIPPTELRPLVGQMASALTAAHSAGVVHRDFKSANVILVPVGDRTRAVVTDFGLARGTEDLQGSNVTGDGGIVGSPAYMAPEQVEGGKVGPAADVYALGIVVYEAVTGEVPFSGSTPLATAVKRLQEPPPSARENVPGAQVPDAWDRAIRRCLARTPAQRFDSPAALVEAIGGDGITQPVGRPRSRSWKRWAIMGALGLGAAAAAVVGVVAQLTRHEGDDPAEAVGAVRPRGTRAAVAILGFKNTTGREDANWMGGALAEMLSTELAVGGKIHLVSGESVARARRELGDEGPNAQTPEAVGRLARALDADYVLVGSFVAQGKERGEKIRIDVKLQEARSGETVLSVAVDGAEKDFVDLVAQAGRELREKMALGRLTAKEEEGLRAATPSRQDAVRLYVEGLTELRMEACSAARGPLEQAVAVEPTFPLAHSALAEALNCLGYEARALEEAEKAVALSQNLPRHIRAQTEARWHELKKEFPEAAAIYQHLFNQFPDNPDYGYDTAKFFIDAAQYDDAQRTIAALRRMPAPLGENPRIDLLESKLVMASGGTTERRLELTRRARANAEKKGARLIEASALLDESGILATMGRADEAVALAQRARVIFEASGDRDGVILAMAYEAGARRWLGDQPGVATLEQGALELAKALGNGRHMSVFYGMQAAAFAAKGDMEGALAAQERLYEHAMGRGEPWQAALAQATAAIIEVELGRPAAARVRLENALTMYERLGGPTKPGLPAKVRSTLLAILVLVTSELGEPGVARVHLGKLRDLWTQGIGDARTQDGILLLEGLLAIDAGDAAAALRTLEQVKPGGTQVTLLLDLLRVDALLALGEVVRADELVQQQLGKPALREHKVLRLYVAIYAARVGTARSRLDDRQATQQLESIIDAATANGLVRCALEARLTLAGLHRHWGHEKLALEQLQAIEDDASRLGLRRIARQAQAGRS